MRRSDEVQGSRSSKRRRRAKVSSGFPLTIVPASVAGLADAF